MYVLYMDDSIIAGSDEYEIKSTIQDIREARLSITEGDDLQGYLGVSIRCQPDGSIHLSQTRIINQISKDLRLDDGKVKPKPRSTAHRRHWANITTPKISINIPTTDPSWENSTTSKEDREATSPTSYTNVLD